jgi:hypothetical protein
MWWLGFAAGGAIVAALFLRRILTGTPSSDIDVGNVSENWLSEQRGRKDS